MLKYTKPPILIQCEICGQLIRKLAPNVRFCPICRHSHTHHRSLWGPKQEIWLAKLEEEVADPVFANCKIYTCTQYPQEFLVKLIPRRIL